MKKLNLILIFCFTATTILSAQKRELREANKMFEKGELQELKDYLHSNQVVFENADQRIIDDLSVLQAKIARMDRDYYRQLEIIKSLESKESYAEQVSIMKDSLVNDLISEAIEANENQNYAEAADKLYMSYTLRPNQYQDYLYFAASTAATANDTLAALDYYNQLKDIKYEGIQTRYFCTEKSSGEELEVSLSEYELFQRSNDYGNFRMEQTPSRYPEVVRNLGILYLQIGDTDTALAIIQEAREENPEDLELILTEGNIYIILDEKEKFLELTEKAALKEPDNALIFFNLGVVTSDLGEKEKSLGVVASDLGEKEKSLGVVASDLGEKEKSREHYEKSREHYEKSREHYEKSREHYEKSREHYEKSIQLDPTYMNSYLNLTALILQDDQEIIDEMNNLGASKADDARYEVLKEQRETLYLETIPLLEKALTIEKHCDIIRTLQNIYNVLDDTNKFNQYKELYHQECPTESTP